MPVVNDQMTDDELRRELIIRTPTAADAFSGNRKWLLDRLGEGTVSILKAREVVPVEIINQLEQVNSEMTLEQLRREFLYRYPTKKKLVRGKWKSWFLFQLHEGSICVATKEDAKAGYDRLSHPDSPQESMNNTVSTAPTILSASTASTGAVEEDTAGCAGDAAGLTKQTIEAAKSRAIPIAKQKYFHASKVARETSQKKAKASLVAASADMSCDMPGNDTESATKTKLRLGNRHRYFKASQQARKNVQLEAHKKEEGVCALLMTPLLHTVQPPAATPTETSAGTKATPKVGSSKWLSDVKEARKHSRRRASAG